MLSNELPQNSVMGKYARSYPVEEPILTIFDGFIEQSINGSEINPSLRLFRDISIYAESSHDLDAKLGIRDRPAFEVQIWTGTIQRVQD